jgi:hypothetical protein
MKKILIFILLICSLTAGAATYYIKTGGSDVAAGTSDGTAWATLAKVQATAFSAGDSILFRRGDTFRGSLYKDAESGSAGNYIYFGAYGTGAKPLILGSKDLSATGDWEVHSGNVWKTTATLGTAQNDIANIIFNDEASVGIKCNAIARLNTQGEFFYNGTDDLLYLYSTSNPGTYYTQVEAAGHHDINQGLIKWYDCDYIHVANFDVRYASAAAIETRSCNYVIIEDNDCSWIGGEWVTPPGTSDSTRVGNGISMVQDNTNIIVRRNNIYQCFDAGISPQAWSAVTQSDISINYNIIRNCWYSYETWCSSGYTQSAVNFDNNTCYDAGDCWSNSLAQRPDMNNGRHVMLWDDQGTVTNCNIRNNIFKDCTNEAVRYSYSADKYQLDYNLYDVDSVAVTGVGSFLTLALWQAAAVAQDPHSIAGDPLFTSATDFHPQSSSPAIDAGIVIAGLTTDFDGNAIGTEPDIGAYEYGARYLINDGKLQINNGKLVVITR